jgi:acyl-CoA reductase-like NAD-dependent aldehyde dehydrogenase
MAFLKHPGYLYVNGEWLPVAGAEPVINPADESLLMMSPAGTAAAIDAALRSSSTESAADPRSPRSRRELGWAPRNRRSR